MSERDEFEAVFPMPPDTIRCGEGYAVTSYNAWKGMEFCAKWKGWKAARAPQAVPALTEPVVRFCPECGSIGEVPVSNINCCPDGSAARYVPQKFAEICQHTFHMLIGKIAAAPQPSPEPAHAHDWRFSLQDHLYKCDCGATRGDYPFGAASFKD